MGIYVGVVSVAIMVAAPFCSCCTGFVARLFGVVRGEGRSRVGVLIVVRRHVLLFIAIVVTIRGIVCVNIDATPSSSSSSSSPATAVATVGNRAAVVELATTLVPATFVAIVHFAPFAVSVPRVYVRVIVRSVGIGRIIRRVVVIIAVVGIIIIIIIVAVRRGGGARRGIFVGCVVHFHFLFLFDGSGVVFFGRFLLGCFDVFLVASLLVFFVLVVSIALLSCQLFVLSCFVRFVLFV